MPSSAFHLRVYARQQRLNVRNFGIWRTNEGALLLHHVEATLVSDVAWYAFVERERERVAGGYNAWLGRALVEQFKYLEATAHALLKNDDVRELAGACALLAPDLRVNLSGGGITHYLAAWYSVTFAAVLHVLIDGIQSNNNIAR